MLPGVRCNSHHGLAHVFWVGPVLCRSCTEYHNGGLRSAVDRLDRDLAHACKTLHHRVRLRQRILASWHCTLPHTGHGVYPNGRLFPRL